MNSNELYHHGIKGMKWGVRRYQREDGTRTTAGQKHARTLTGGVAGAIRKKQRSNAEKDLARTTSKQKQVNSELRELRGYSKTQVKSVVQNWLLLFEISRLSLWNGPILSSTSVKKRARAL